MDAVILTFPGHFYQTMLCVCSIKRWYPEIKKYYFIIDDVQADPWLDYREDFVRSMRSSFADLDFLIYSTGDRQEFRECAVGWWRQQLVKLSLDQIIPGEQWLVVDGDVVFCRRYDICDVIPVSVHANVHDGVSKMSAHYVSRLLDISPGYLMYQGNRVMTNPIPFRYLDSTTLLRLRQHVECVLDSNFIDQHLRWYADQTIVLHADPPDRLVMTEWELIECFRHYVFAKHLPLVSVSPGYSNIKTPNTEYYHLYHRDTDIGPDWFRAQGIDISIDIWNKAQHWLHHREPNRII